MEQELLHPINIVCPICKTRKKINLTVAEIKKSSNLTTISVQKNLICPHHFQIFIDKNFKIRGYQKVDLEIASEHNDKLIRFPRNREHLAKKNYPRNIERNYKNKEESCDLNLKDIYDMFWKYIYDDNAQFKEFIEKDSRRKEYLK